MTIKKLKSVYATVVVLFAAMLILPSAAMAREAYVIVSEGSKTLTFYYDNHGKSRKGTKYSLPSDISDPKWMSLGNNTITMAVFDASFKDYRPTSVFRWFFALPLETIKGIEYLNTSEVINMKEMFGGCSALKTLDVSKFNTEKVVNMRYMFSACHALKALDVSKFNISKVADMGNMFTDCKALSTIYCDKGWKCAKSDGMFLFCANLKGAVSYNSEKTDFSMANPEMGYFTRKNVAIQHVIDGETLDAAQVKAIYTVEGHQIPTLQKGVNIVVYMDGTARKVFIEK